jgi:protein translocase SecG subunit
MLYEIGLFFFCFVALLVIFFVSMQKSQGGIFGGQSSQDSTIVFGGSGGSEFMQRVTWTLGFILILGTLFLSIYRTRLYQNRDVIVKREEVDKQINKFKEEEEERYKGHMSPDAGVGVGLDISL